MAKRKLIPRLFRFHNDEYAAFMQAAELNGENGSEVIRRLTQNYSRRVFIDKATDPLSYNDWRKGQKKNKK